MMNTRETHDLSGWVQRQKGMLSPQNFEKTFVKPGDVLSLLNIFHQCQNAVHHVIVHRLFDLVAAIDTEETILKKHLMAEIGSDTEQQKQMLLNMKDVYGKIFARNATLFCNAKVDHAASNFMTLLKLERVLQDPLLRYTKNTKTDTERQTTLAPTVSKGIAEWVQTAKELCMKELESEIINQPSQAKVIAVRNIDIICTFTSTIIKALFPDKQSAFSVVASALNNQEHEEQIRRLRQEAAQLTNIYGSYICATLLECMDNVRVCTEKLNTNNKMRILDVPISLMLQETNSGVVS